MSAFRLSARERSRYYQVVYVNKGQKGGSLAPLDPPRSATGMHCMPGMKETLDCINYMNRVNCTNVVTSGCCVGDLYSLFLRPGELLYCCQLSIPKCTQNYYI